MTAQEHALARLRLALETGNWEFVEAAHDILDGAINGHAEKPEPFKVPEGVRHMLRAT